MKRADQEQVEKLERALAQAHATQDAPAFPHRWVDSVMRDIRLQSSGARTSTDVPFLVWRAAAVVVALSLVLVGSALTWYPGQADIPFSVLSEATVDTTLLAGDL